jgi:penicillin-binding protein 2
MVRRALWLQFWLVLLIAVLAGRLFVLQVLRAAPAAKMAYEQQTLALPLAGRRGLILDRKGQPLSDAWNPWGVALFPPLIPVSERERVAQALSGLLPEAGPAIDAALTGPRREPLWLPVAVEEALGRRIAALGLPGVAVARRGERYGADPLARHLVGYFNDQGGRMGLEAAFDRELAGEAVPVLTAAIDGRYRVRGAEPFQTVIPAVGKQPYTLHTTIDRDVQAAVERALDRLRGDHPAAAVVLDPTSGEVLAMASRPQFAYDQNGQPFSSEPGFWYNRAVTGFAPGSVFKTMVAAAALEAGLVRLDEEFVCTGHYQIGNNHFRDADGVSHGRITFAEAIARSCNIVFLQVGYERLGIQRLQALARQFGFGEPTGLLGRPWPEEQAGAIPTGQGAVQIAFGQGGLLATPLQIARAYAAIANDGVMPALKLVTTARNPAGEVMYRPPAGRSERVMSKATAALLRRALTRVTEPDGTGTGKAAWVANGGSAGKTGSAQGTSVDGRPAVHAWFAGFVPAGTPRYVIVVMVEGGGSGGQVAAPIFRAIGERLMAQD